jgi:hypothetical protein
VARSVPVLREGPLSDEVARTRRRSGQSFTLLRTRDHRVRWPGQRLETEAKMRNGGLSLGGILVILGIVLIIVWSFWWGLIIGLVGLVFFGGFAKGRWY